MADVSLCLLAHLRADTGAGGVATLLGAAGQINRQFDASGTLPQLYLKREAGQDVSAGTGTARISVLVEALSPATASGVHDRLRKLFHGKSNYTLGAGGNTVFCVNSERASEPVEDQFADDNAWESQAFYEFTVTETF